MILCDRTHEYLKESNGGYIVGLTDFFIEKMGDIIFIELPEVGAEFTKGDIFGTIETVRGAKELYMPVTGVVTEINEDAIANPEITNERPLEDGWLIKVESESAPEDSSDLMEYDDYVDELS